MNTVMYVLGIIVIIIGLILVGPYLSILAINTLFAAEIPVNFWTWCSMAWIHLVLYTPTSLSKK